MKHFVLTLFLFQITCSASNSNSLSDDIFQTIWQSRGKAVASGAYGNIYIVSFQNQKYALKQIKDPKNNQAVLQEDVQGNEALLSNIKALNTQSDFYKKNIKSLTQYYGVFSTLTQDSVLVFEAAPGKSFDAYLEQMSPGDRYSKETFYNISVILSQYAYWLHLQHEAGIVNRDAKGQNFHIQKKEKGFSIKGLDHGTVLNLADINNGEHRTKPNVGSYLYFAPEIIKRKVDKKGYSPAVDVFSLGIEILNSFANFFSNKTIFKFYWDLSDQYERPETFQSLPNWFSFFDQVLSNTEDKGGSVDLFLQNINVLSDEQKDFLGNLIKDCCAFNAKNRINAAQVGFLLEKFASSFKDEAMLDYQNAKDEAVKQWPFTVPEIITKMITSSPWSLKGYVALYLLRLANSAYKKTKEYSVLMQKNENLDKDLKMKAKVLAHIALGNMDNVKLQKYAPIIKSIKNEIYLEEFKILDSKKTIPMPYNILINLGKIDKDFQSKRTYGLALLQKGDEKLLPVWAKDNRRTLKTLMKEAFIIDLPNAKNNKTIPMTPYMILNLGRLNKYFQKKEIYQLAHKLQNEKNKKQININERSNLQSFSEEDFYKSSFDLLDTEKAFSIESM